MGNITLIKNFLHYLRIEKRYSVHTTVSYRNDLNQFNLYLSESYSGIEFRKVEMIHVRSYMVHLLEAKLAKSTVARKVSSIKSLYKFLKREQLISSSPVQLLETPKLDSRLPVFLKEEDVVNLFEEFKFEDSFSGKRDKMLLYLFYQTGIRLSELIGLKDVDVRNGELKVLGKRNKERIIPLSNNIQPLIDQYLNLKDELGFKKKYFFVTDKGNKLYEKFVYRKVNHYLSIVSSKQKKSPHILRHTFATHMLNNGADLNSIKEILGHENLSATQVYTHNTFQKLKSIHKQSHPRG
ncbi:MAG: tyrosine-type recombinase/integrase [Flavobacteriales bacterium]|nr:tyrosine-type recombinase/integrase [Flavobacteriales bacterium]